VLRTAPIDVANLLRSQVWDEKSAVLSSATIPPSFTQKVGLPADSTDVIDVGSPFDFEHNALLYCATHLPDPRRAEHAAGVVEELTSLIEAAGGRTLALFTSWRAMDHAADAVRSRVDVAVLTQREFPKPRLIGRFAAEPETCLFATMSFWQGVDVPGEALSLVTIDRLPFPRPDEPLLQARRERAGPAAFALVDVPRAAMLLAQGAGRLIRTARDRGVVAVLDPRLATARYRWDIIRALPPMRRTRDRAEVERFLRDLRA
jgi:ATP-dependent DNA helicase DinG